VKERSASRDPAGGLCAGTPIFFLLRELDAAERARIEAEGRDPSDAFMLWADGETGMVVGFSERETVEALQRLYGGEIEELELQAAVAREFELDRALLIRTPDGEFTAILDPSHGAPSQ
jgi:hypothetical protein